MNHVLRRRIMMTALVVASIAVVAVASSERPTAQERLENSEMCLACHDGYDSGLMGSAHEVSTAIEQESDVAVTCIDCHTGWEAHLEDPSEETMSSPAVQPALAQAAACASCHITPHQVSMISGDPHLDAGLACADCHQVHDNSNSRLVLSEGGSFCLTCHTNVTAEFRRQSAHPTEAAGMTCLSCHDWGGLQSPMTAVGFDWKCQECHSELSGPFLHEHPATQMYLTDGGGCIECHEPHGSANARLLKQPGDGLCGQCHGTPPGHRIAHGGLGTRLDCVDCHSEVHGSNDNGKLLDPMLGTKLFPDCYQSGCHAIGN